jgi:hypothetical protein
MNIACQDGTRRFDALKDVFAYTGYDDMTNGPRAFKDVFGIAVTLGRAESARAEKQCV